MLGSAIPQLHVDSASFAKAERFERWRSSIGNTFTLALAEGERAEAFSFRVSFWQQGRLLLGQARYSARRQWRSARNIRLDQVDHYSSAGCVRCMADPAFHRCAGACVVERGQDAVRDASHIFEMPWPWHGARSFFRIALWQFVPIASGPERAPVVVPDCRSDCAATGCSRTVAPSQPLTNLLAGTVMTGFRILILLAMSILAVHRPSMRHAVVGRTRFRLALSYATVGIMVGGLDLPPDARAWAVLGAGLLASLAVGVVRGRFTRRFQEPDGRVSNQGTRLTIGLFVLLVTGKFAWSAWEYLQHAQPHGGFGEVLVMIALMVAMQAEIVWQRVRAMAGSRAATPAPLVA